MNNKDLIFDNAKLKKYIEFFSNPDSIYMHIDGASQPYYIGTAKEFVSDLNNARLPEDYDDLNNNVFKGQKWLYIDRLSALADDFIDSLTSRQILTIFSAMEYKELFCTGFIARCGRAGIISRLLLRLRDCNE